MDIPISSKVRDDVFVNQKKDAQFAHCPLTAALEAIGGKWNLICLSLLGDAPRRFCELQKLMPMISHKVLTETLRCLEQHELVTRTDFNQFPPHVVYSISDYGESLRPLMLSIQLWGRVHLERQR